MEKAHHDVFNMLLQILDEGRLTDGKGRTVDFKNTIVIMTSNLGSERILEYAGAFQGEAYEEMKGTVLEELGQCFRPEFLNRIDETIVFHALCQDHLKQIVDIQLDELRLRLAERKISIELTDEARNFLVRVGYDPKFGARPLKRAIQKELKSPLAAIIHKFGVSVDFLRKFRAESVFRCDYKASKLVEPNRDEARAPSGNSSARRGLYICVGAGSQGTVRWDTDGASVMRRAFVRDKTMPGAPRCDEKFPEPGHRF